ncbi:MAG: hypothetical protein R2856_18555 [Caldilineaceae bacterium]
MVTGLFELAIGGVAAGFAFVRHADDGDMFLGEEVLNQFIQRSHEVSFPALKLEVSMIDNSCLSLRNNW